MSTTQDSTSSSVDPRFKIQAIPHPPHLLPRHIERYREIRLLSLKVDPQAFGSTFERESQFSDEVWRERAAVKGKVTFYAYHDFGLVASGLSPAEEGEWIGTATILYPEFILPENRPTLPSRLTAEGTSHEDVYLLVGMWVRPRWRRRGVGKALVEEALKHVGARNPHDDGSEGKSATTRKVTVLDVHKVNEAACGLYETIGFWRNDCGGGEADEVGEGGERAADRTTYPGTIQMYYVHE